MPKPGSFQQAENERKARRRASLRLTAAEVQAEWRARVDAEALSYLRWLLEQRQRR